MENLILDGHKINWHPQRLKAWLAGERIAPITIDCALTRQCTYRCRYCYSRLQVNDEKKMTREVIFRFLDDVAEIGVKAISLVSDGESTCSPYFYDAILKGHQNGLDMAVGTNGYLLQAERLEEILPALTYLRFNVSAAEPVRYAQIHGCPPGCFDQVCQIIRQAVKIKKTKRLKVTLGLQMVFLPDFIDQLKPLIKLGQELGVDYTIIKHCSDDEQASLGVDYLKYHNCIGALKAAEAASTQKHQIYIKWSKILSDGKRCYSRCYGPPFIMQLSGSGLVAPCGMLFNTKFSKFHIGNIAEQSFKQLWQSDRYWEVMDLIRSENFDARSMCGTLCLQHKVNEFLWELKQNKTALVLPQGDPPEHLNFI